jgi:hypothetical protein
LRTTCPAIPVTLYINCVQQVLPVSIRNLLGVYDVTEWQAYRRQLLSYSKFRTDEPFQLSLLMAIQQASDDRSPLITIISKIFELVSVLPLPYSAAELLRTLLEHHRFMGLHHLLASQTELVDATASQYDSAMHRHNGRSAGWQSPSNNQQNGQRNRGQGRNRSYRGNGGTQAPRGPSNTMGGYRTPRVTATTRKVRQLNVDDESAKLMEILRMQDAYENPVIPHLSIPVALTLTRIDKVRIGLLGSGAEVSCLRLDVVRELGLETSLTADSISQPLLLMALN